MISHHIHTGSDDLGNFYSSHSQLDAAQTANRTKWYAANDKFWAGSGYGGKTDNEVNLFLSVSILFMCSCCTHPIL